MSLSKNELEDLIESLILTDEVSKASELILSEYGPRATKLLLNYRVNNDHDRQTIIHDAIEKFIEKLKSEENLTFYQTYFNSICINKAKDWKKKFVNKNFFSVTYEYFTQFYESVTAKGVVEDFRIDEVKKALSSIGENCRRRIELFHIKGFSHAELVVQFENTDNVRTSRVQLTRCMNKLREKLGIEWHE